MGRNPAAAELLERLRRRITDPRVLAAIAAVPREHFVAPGDRTRAYDDEPLSIGGGQTISQPFVVARMLELLDLRRGERVLDVGTGSGWHAALLAHLGGRVVSIDRDARLVASAARNLAAANVAGVELRVGDGFDPTAVRGPHDVINVAAAAPLAALEALEGQLADGGRLVAPLVGVDDDQRLVLTRRAGGRLARYELEPVRFVPLLPGLAGDATGPA